MDRKLILEEQSVLPVKISSVGVSFLVVVGMGLIGYGLVVGDEGSISVETSEPIEESDLERDVPVTEYDHLPPDHQDAFRDALQSGEGVQVDEAPEAQGDYIEYRDSYYRLYVEYSAAGKTTMFFSVVGGILLLLIGSVGWIYFERRSRHVDD